MQIAISGGNGRIGRATTDLALAQEHSLVSIDQTPSDPETTRPGVTYIQADITDYTKFEDSLRGCDALIHLAAIPSPWRNPEHVVHNNNVVGSYNALIAAAKLGIRRVCQASSINATGGVFSRQPRFDYFPLDEKHPTYNEDPYSLSKWICEQQADSIVRRYEDMTIASLRFHGVVPDRAIAVKWQASPTGFVVRHLWGYTHLEAAARACLLSITADFTGHEAFYIVAPDTMMGVPSSELKEQYYPDVPLASDLDGNQGFFNCHKAKRLLGWQHNNLKRVD